MGSRKTHEGADNVYAAAQLWVDRALRADDSLFTPGTPIWSRKWLRELRERFLDRPDAGEGSFYDKLKSQLEDSPPEVYQLMAEVLYVHFLIVLRSTLGGNAKEDRLNQVVGWSDQDIRMPPDLVGALSIGIAASESFNRFRPYHAGFLIEFAEQWKALESSERQLLLEDPWAFKGFVTGLGFQSELLRPSSNQYRAQREALLHLVFPGDFEGTVSVEQKEGIARARAFAHFITESTDDVDRKIQQIRRGLEAGLGRDFDFYDSDVRSRWDPSDSVAWDRYIGIASDFLGSGQLEERELRYKFEIGRRLAEAREAVDNDSDNWADLVKKGIHGILIHPIAQAKFKDWVDESPGAAHRALRELWTQDNVAVAERIRAFSNELPTDVLGGSGSRMTVISQLLMGLDAEQYPPFRVTAFDIAYERTGYEPRPKEADEAALYEHALGFLDQFIEEARARGVPVRHRLDAQALFWAIPYHERETGGNGTTPHQRTEDLDQLAEKLRLPIGFLREIETLLADKKQVIFQGPPGTGKTYVAQELANHLAGSKDRVTLVQFHPSYAYEDFVQGFRPATLEDGQPGFELRDGPLRKAAKRARKEPDAKHFLIIDEINRGQIAKVFGELYFLLEYRESKINLQYSDKPFSLPDNLYIIGTMNTADRSIALVDLALRRRFYFVEFHPDDEPVKEVLRRWLKAKGLDGMDWVADVVERANEKMEDDRHAAIGPSYFMKDNLNEGAVERIWKHSVLPYIEERRFGDEDGAGEFDLTALRREVKGTSEVEDNATQGDEGEGEQSENGGE